MRILNHGSINADHVDRVARLPRPGGHARGPGGRAANRSPAACPVAAADATAAGDSSLGRFLAALRVPRRGAAAIAACLAERAR